MDSISSAWPACQGSIWRSDHVSWHSSVSVANKISGSQTGSQRPQAQGDARPHPAIRTCAERHVRPHLAPPGHTSKVPPKQQVPRSGRGRGADSAGSYPSRAVTGIQNADTGLPGRDDLPSAQAEGAVMKRALDLLIPPQIAVTYPPMAAL